MSPELRAYSDFTMAGLLGTARFSEGRAYRYWLSRYVPILQMSPRYRVRDRGTLNVIGLNPSTADENVNDPTLRRCIGFARTWGFSRLIVTNAFAFRSKDPAALRTIADPNGPDNDVWLYHMAEGAQMVLVAWSGLATFRDRSTEVRAALVKLARPLYCLGLTRYGEPRHPLYMKADTKPVRFM